MTWLAGLALATAIGGQPITTLDGRTMTVAEVDRQVEALRSGAGVTGLSVALINDGRVVYLNSFGARNVAKGLPLTPDTVTYGASLTKATFAYLIMQLVDEGRIHLDRPIAAYLPKALPDYPKYADLGDEPRWRALTFRILLNHTSGFANFRFLEPDGKLRMHWAPGARYGYSGEGINLAQFVLENGLGMNLAEEMQRRVFDRFGMTRTSLTWRDAFADDAADVYLKDGSAQAHHKRESVRAAGSMDTTARDWSAFLAAVVRGDGLTARSKAEMIRASIRIDSASQFPTLQDTHTDENTAIQLGYGVGWGVFETPYGHAFFKEGHDDGTGNFALCVDLRKACILLMSNSDRAEGVFNTLVVDLLGEVNLPWRWENYAPNAQVKADPGGDGAGSCLASQPRR